MAEEQQGSLYKQRLQKELAVPEEQIIERIDWSKPILAENQKCSVSLDLPIINCKPTAACSEVCYACQGRQVYRNAIVKSLAINRMISTEPERAARKIVDEAAGREIRLAGSGELLPQHGTLVHTIERLGGKTWGFTRRVDTHQALPHLMFSLDATTPASVLSYAKREVPVSRRSYLRRPGDPPAPIDVAVTFPVHGPRTRYTDQVQLEKNDCPSVRHAVEGCWACKRCY